MERKKYRHEDGRVVEVEFHPNHVAFSPTDGLPLELEKAQEEAHDYLTERGFEPVLTL